MEIDTETGFILIKEAMQYSKSDFEKSIANGWREMTYKRKRALFNGKVIFVPTIQMKKTFHFNN